MIPESVVSRPDFRVRLVPATVADAPRMYAALVPEATKNLSFFSTENSLDRQWFFLEKIEKSQGDMLFVVELVVDGSAVGTIGLREFDHGNRNARLGALIFRPEDRGKGYNREATQLLFRHAFTELRLHKIYVRVLRRNGEAIAKHLRMGFQIESTFREEYLLDGEYLDMIGLSLLDREWATTQK